MIPFTAVAPARRKLSFPTLPRSKKYNNIMAHHRPRMRMDLADRAPDSAPVHSSSSQSAGSPSANLSNLVLPISTRFSVGHAKAKSKDSGASSSNKASPKKPRDKKKQSRGLVPTISPPETLALNEVSVEVLKEWEVSFNSLLKHPDGVDLFEGFLKSEFSEENIQFWKACEKFKSVPDHLVDKEAAVVFEEFLAPQAPKLINIDHQTSKEIVENMKHPDRATFNRAQQSIYLLMARDSFVRFIKSDQFQQALKR